MNRMTIRVTLLYRKMLRLKIRRAREPCVRPPAGAARLAQGGRPAPHCTALFDPA